MKCLSWRGSAGRRSARDPRRVGSAECRIRAQRRQHAIPVGRLPHRPTRPRQQAAALPPSDRAGRYDGTAADLLASLDCCLDRRLVGLYHDAAVDFSELSGNHAQLHAFSLL